VSSRESGEVLYITAAMTVRAIETAHAGVECVAPLENRLLYGAASSPIVRMIAADGREVRSFVGHTAPVKMLARLNDSLFASGADDGTIRVWDVRERFPVVSVTTDAIGTACLAGSSEYLVAGMRNRVVDVLDLRGAIGRPVLEVATQDYEAVHLQYNQSNDVLAMFGVGERADGKVFESGDPFSSRVFRVYAGFVGVEAP
jgi:WD40 repeat protein